MAEWDLALSCDKRTPYVNRPHVPPSPLKLKQLTSPRQTHADSQCEACTPKDGEATEPGLRSKPPSKELREGGGVAYTEISQYNTNMYKSYHCLHSLCASSNASGGEIQKYICKVGKVKGESERKFHGTDHTLEYNIIHVTKTEIVYLITKRAIVVSHKREGGEVQLTFICTSSHNEEGMCRK
ncbi:hypothetical protein J6590_077909 [Homalodisca vitripennis]|nr:hypothetical protein J6590_077909 [Homalodisca vitripennis]